MPDVLAPAPAASDAARSDAPPSAVRPARADGDGLRWDGVDLLAYKPAGTHFEGITRQVLFDGSQAPGVELRYFEVAPGGHSTFERHAHVHAVMVLRGRGAVLVGEAVHPLGERDLVHVPPMTWHQFHAADDAPLGFLCLVACDRDRPQRPTDAEAEALRQHPVVGPFARL